MTKIEDQRFPESDLRIHAVQIISAILVPALMPRLFLSSAGLDLDHHSARDLYVKKLVDRFFG